MEIDVVTSSSVQAIPLIPSIANRPALEDCCYHKTNTIGSRKSECAPNIIDKGLLAKHSKEKKAECNFSHGHCGKIEAFAENIVLSYVSS